MASEKWRKAKEERKRHRDYLRGKGELMPKKRDEYGMIIETAADGTAALRYDTANATREALAKRLASKVDRRAEKQVAPDTSDIGLHRKKPPHSGKRPKFDNIRAEQAS